MSMYVYHWAAMSGDSRSHEIHDGTTERSAPIASNDDYLEFKKYLIEHLGKTGLNFNITSLSLLHSPTTGGGNDE